MLLSVEVESFFVAAGADAVSAGLLEGSAEAVSAGAAEDVADVPDDGDAQPSPPPQPAMKSDKLAAAATAMNFCGE